jgi:hypothetical protein
MEVCTGLAVTAQIVPNKTVSVEHKYNVYFKPQLHVPALYIYIYTINSLCSNSKFECATFIKENKNTGYGCEICDRLSSYLISCNVRVPCNRLII